MGLATSALQLRTHQRGSQSRHHQPVRLRQFTLVLETHRASVAIPRPRPFLLLCDCGGSNSANQYLFKHDLQALVDDLGIEDHVAHYPSYCSKYNPIERRFFPHVGRACQGVLFDTLDTVVRLMRNASTRTGLKTTVNIIRRIYETGRQVSEDFKASMPILR